MRLTDLAQRVRGMENGGNLTFFVDNQEPVEVINVSNQEKEILGLLKQIFINGGPTSREHFFRMLAQLNPEAYQRSQPVIDHIPESFSDIEGLSYYSKTPGREGIREFAVTLIRAMGH